MDRGVVVRAHTRRQRFRRARRMRRHYARRLPKNAPKPSAPGDRLQIDTLHLGVEPGKWLKHFSAVCPVSRWTVGEVYYRATATNAARFLDKVLDECPFEVQTIQVDGGSEFMAGFETACQKRGIELFVLPPRSPKLNGSLERIQETWRGELYEAYEMPATVEELRPIVQRFQHLYNHRRPHRSLRKRTPASYLGLPPARGRLQPPVPHVLN